MPSDSKFTTLSMAPFTGLCFGKYDDANVELQVERRVMRNTSDFARSLEMVPAANVTNSGSLLDIRRSL